MKVVTVFSHRPIEGYYLSDAFFASCRRFGHEPLILGNGKSYGGLGSKPRLLKQAIETGLVNDEHLIFTDSYDVIFQDDPNKAQRDVLTWNCERSCFPDASLAEKHPETWTSFRYFNSGFVSGRTTDMLKALVEMKAEHIPNDSPGNEPNDQNLFMRQFLFGSVPMKLDNETELCMTMCSVKRDEIEFCNTVDGPRIGNVETGNIPIAIHFNGPGKTQGLREPVLQHLGL